jgi:hypothetical protein
MQQRYLVPPSLSPLLWQGRAGQGMRAIIGKALLDVDAQTKDNNKKQHKQQQQQTTTQRLISSRRMLVVCL